ncbi:MAG: hypothetical protein H6736_12465 [Alphaproteobacteria bacterium]|nr:hypothetical protein [Alphaproteobacteria bacterium]
MPDESLEAQPRFGVGGSREVPYAFRNLAHVVEDGLAVQVGWFPWWSVAIGFGAPGMLGVGVAGVAVLAALLAVTAESVVFAVLTFLVLLFGVALMALTAGSGLMLMVQRAPMVLSARGWRIDHPLAHWNRRASAVQILGPPGQAKVALRGPLHTTLWQGYLAPEGASGPSWQDAMWLAHAAAGALGVPLEDHLDSAEQERWRVDPRFRARLRFEESMARNRASYAAWHAVEPTEPELRGSDPHTLAGGSWSLTAERFRAEIWSASTESMCEVGAFFEHGEHGTYGYLLVSTTTGQWKAAGRPIRGRADAARLKGEAELIRERAAQARPRVRGTDRDIPETLGGLRVREG